MGVVMAVDADISDTADSEERADRAETFRRAGLTAAPRFRTGEWCVKSGAWFRTREWTCKEWRITPDRRIKSESKEWPGSVCLGGVDDTG